MADTTLMAVLVRAAAAPGADHGRHARDGWGWSFLRRHLQRHLPGYDRWSALSPRATWGGLEPEPEIAVRGSATLEGVVSWTWAKLNGAEEEYPAQPSAQGAGGGETASPNPCEWLGLGRCRPSFDEGHVFRSEHHSNRIAPTVARQKALIRAAATRGGGTLIRVEPLTEARPGMAVPCALP